MKRPRVAIIGAGIFGISCALELADRCDVVIFEQNDDIMRGGTYGNQYRHHLGFHYPRSAATVEQCLGAQDSFKSVWGESIDSQYPAYYAIAKAGTKISANDFLNFCDQFKLSYQIEYPGEEWLNPEAVELCIKTAEPIYNYPRLRTMAHNKIKATSGISLRLSSEVTSVKLLDNGIKQLEVLINKNVEEISVDYVVNAMYTNHNLLYHWLGIPAPLLEFRLKELVVIKLPVDQSVAVTIMDGQFVTIVPMAEKGLFTLGDVGRSIHEISVSAHGQPWGRGEQVNKISHFPEMQEANPFFIPLIRSAEYVRSIFTVLPVRPNTTETDERTTTVTAHGHGC